MKHMRPFPKAPIEEKSPIYDNELTRRTEQAHSSAKYTRIKLDPVDTEKGFLRKDQAFRATIDYVLGEGWYATNKIGRIMREKRNKYKIENVSKL